jgi:hypothetical protein
MVLPQPSREERPTALMSRMNSAASGRGTWWNWKFWRVVMWPLASGTQRSTAAANASICSGLMPPKGSLTRIIWRSAWRWP